MTMMLEEVEAAKVKNLRGVQEIIEQGMKKVRARKENDLCRYLPIKTGGYLHHFSFKKMKKQQPSELAAMIEMYITNNALPQMVPPKRRAPRGSRKQSGHLPLTRGLLDRLLGLAHKAEDKEIIDLLSPKRPLKVCKRELISSIKNGRVEQRLWDSYVETLNSSLQAH